MMYMTDRQCLKEILGTLNAPRIKGQSDETRVKLQLEYLRELVTNQLAQKDKLMEALDSLNRLQYPDWTGR